AVSIRGPPVRGVFRHYRRREGPKGHARPRNPHRGQQARGVRAREVRGSLRKRAEGPAAQEAEGRENRTTKGARTYQCGEPDGRTAPKCASVGRQAVKCGASQNEKRQKAN